VRGGITGQGSTIWANRVTRGRLSGEGSACPRPCGVRELDIFYLFRLSPKAALNPELSCPPGGTTMDVNYTQFTRQPTRCLLTMTESVPPL
jgi:hypothetical protein